MENTDSSSDEEHKSLEKQIRNYMENPLSHLAPLIPNQNPMEMMALTDQLHEAANYIKNLEKMVGNMKERKKLLLGTEGSDLGFRFPNLEVNVLDSILEVVLISESFYQSVFYEAINVLEDEGAEIVSVSLCAREGKAFHTIHSQITDTRILNATRICERLKKLVQ